MIKVSELTREDARRLVQRAFVGLAKDVGEGFELASSRPDLELDEQRFLSEERLSELRQALLDQQYPPQAKLFAETMLQGMGSSLDAIKPKCGADLAHGMTRALIEQQRLFQFRMSERLLPWAPDDPLFREVNCTEAARLSPPTPSIAIDCTVGPCVSEAVEAYFSYGGNRWTAKTSKGRNRMLSYLVEYLGADMPLAAVTSHDIRNFRDGIKRLRCNQHRGPANSFAARQTDNQEMQIAPKTAQLIFEPTKAFFKWCKSVQGYLPADPAADVRIDLGKKKAGPKSRRPFTAPEGFVA